VLLLTPGVYEAPPHPAPHHREPVASQLRREVVPVLSLEARERQVGDEFVVGGEPVDAIGLLDLVEPRRRYRFPIIFVRFY
jgi:hypothetical protein